jgi:hypothetical protein
MISVLVLTLNEEANLPRCLESLWWSDDVVVFDSGSTDRTARIAESMGARVIHHRFDNWSGHLNWAVRNIEFKHPWVYYSDADECVPPDLMGEMQAVVADTTRCQVAYRLRFKNMFMGKWIKRSGLYPTWVLRLFQPRKVRWERLVNPVAIIDGPEGRLQTHFEHHSFNKGLAEWFAKHNRYSSDEAHELIASVDTPIDWGGILSADPPRRRKALKNLAFRMPCRPLLVFCYLYIARLGLLDGRAGLTYCALRGVYEYMIDVKVKELYLRTQGLPV